MTTKVIFRLISTSAIALFFSTTALAASIPGITGGALSSLKLNQVDKVQTLVDKKYDPATNTTLSIKITTYDLGGSSEAANLTNIYLSSFSFNEEKNGGALHLITKAANVLSAKRLSAGVYQVVVEEWPVGPNWPSPADDFRLCKVSYTVEASQLTVDLRELTGVPEFGSKQFTTPISVSRSVLN